MTVANSIKVSNDRPALCVVRLEGKERVVGSWSGKRVNHRVHRVAMAAFWRTFHHEG
jgi:hypothetical protein